MTNVLRAHVEDCSRAQILTLMPEGLSFCAADGRHVFYDLGTRGLSPTCSGWSATLYANDNLPDNLIRSEGFKPHFAA